MTKMIYRGVAYEAGAKSAQTLAEQMKRHELVYRGVEHDGERATPAAPRADIPLFYRGLRIA